LLGSLFAKHFGETQSIKFSLETAKTLTEIQVLQILGNFTLPAGCFCLVPPTTSLSDRSVAKRFQLLPMLVLQPVHSQVTQFNEP